MQILKYLQELGADTDLLDSDGCTPIHNAAFQGCKKCVDFLIKNGADINKTDLDGATAIHKVTLNAPSFCESGEKF